MSDVKVVATDLTTGESEEQVIKAGDYVIITNEPCRVDGIQTYREGRTHVITVKDRLP
jgi:translation elongation factor P/translation initiation factor 5A